MHFKAPFTLLLAFTIHFTFGQKVSFSTKIDSLLQTDTPRKFNGTVIISRNGDIQYSKSYGLADVDSNTAIKPNDQFIIGSISKQITAVLVLQQVDKGRLSLTEPIKLYLPELSSSWVDSVSIHHLLNHTSGIIATDKPLAFTPGTQFTYSPFVAYELLANIIEKASGETYASLAKRLFDSCKMMQTTIPALYDQREAPNKNLISSYYEDSDTILVREKYKLQDIAFATPGGAIISTARDLVLWNKCLHRGKLLKKESYKLMTTASTDRPGHRWGTMGYGYGIQIIDRKEQLEYSHSGALLGFISSNLYYPDSKISLVILENISTDFDDISRAFYFHDQLREIIRAKDIH